METEFHASDGVLPLIERPFAAEDQFVDFVLVGVVAQVRQERFSVAVDVDLRHRDVEVLGTDTAYEVSQLATEPLAEEYVQVALRGGIEDHQEFAELVEMLKEAMVIGDVHVAIGIVGEERREGNGRHNADQIGGDDDHQHVCHIVTLLLVGIDPTVALLTVGQGVDQVEIQFQDHQERNDTHEKAIDEESDRDSIG